MNVESDIKVKVFIAEITVRVKMDLIIFLEMNIKVLALISFVFLRIFNRSKVVAL